MDRSLVVFVIDAPTALHWLVRPWDSSTRSLGFTAVQNTMLLGRT